mgnify:CR=1 FL=1
MLKITIPACGEQYDAVNNIFLPGTKEQTITIEHSLVSISKWEAKWHKPYLTKDEKTTEEIIDYVRCMTLTQNVDPNVYGNLRFAPELLEEISNYINQSMTATTFSNRKQNISREIITSELIYYWMIYYGIPFECQKWHLNRLLTLINVCNVKNAPQKKMSRQELLANNRALNAARRKRLNTKG